MPAAIVWTNAIDVRLLEARSAGASWQAIATELHVGRNAAIERARRLGLVPSTRLQPPPRAPVERIDRPTLPPGHPLSWQAITDGTALAGEPYPYPVFL